MSSETIVIYIDPAQIQAQKNNKYSLYLAKKVNGEFTVIWQSKGPVATVNTPSYEYKNTFKIALPSYQINYGSLSETSGSVTFTSGGKAVDIDVGQKTTLSEDGLFSAATNGGTPGSLVVDNNLKGNPHESLNDSNGNPLFVNVASGMDTGKATLTPIDEYQIWFYNHQQTGTIIADNVSNPTTVTFDGSVTSKTITFNAAGQWEPGAPALVTFDVEAVNEEAALAVTVAALFTTALTMTAVTYLLGKLIDKFSGDLKPRKITTSLGAMKLEVVFAVRDKDDDANLGLDSYEAAVNDALNAAKNDRASGLSDESWTLSEPALTTYLK